jgi:hypothetical protein
MNAAAEEELCVVKHIVAKLDAKLPSCAHVCKGKSAEYLTAASCCTIHCLGNRLANKTSVGLPNMHAAPTPSKLAGVWIRVA